MNWIIIRSNIQFVIILTLACIGVFELSIWFHEYLHTRYLKTSEESVLCFDLSGNNKNKAWVYGKFYTSDENVHFGVYLRHGIFLGIVFMALMISGIQLMNVANKAFMENEYLKKMAELDEIKEAVRR